MGFQVDSNKLCLSHFILSPSRVLFASGTVARVLGIYGRVLARGLCRITLGLATTPPILRQPAQQAQGIMKNYFILSITSFSLLYCKLLQLVGCKRSLQRVLKEQHCRHDELVSIL